MKKIVKIGKNKKIDKTAIVGYLPERKVKDKKLRIGFNARIRSGSVIYLGSLIGDSLQTGHNVLVREENRIGNNVCIWSNSVIDYGCVIGNNVKIHNNVYIAQFTVIEDDCFIGPGVTVTNDLCPVCTKCMKGPTIRKGAKIGANVTLLPHITIGENSLIGAGSVVTKDIPACSLAYGAPAKVVKNVNELKCRMGVIKRPYEC